MQPDERTSGPGAYGTNTRWSAAVYVVVAVTAAVEHQRHETAADHEGENDAEDHGYVAMDAHLNVDTVPGINGPPEREA